MHHDAFPSRCANTAFCSGVAFGIKSGKCYSSNAKNALRENTKLNLQLFPGTYIGKALRHTRDQVLKHNNRPNVGDMLWVLTDGKSNDEFRSVAASLRQNGVEVD